MKVIDYIKENLNLDLIANMLVYPEKQRDMDGCYEIWKAKDINGNELEIFDYNKDYVIKRIKEYLESEL